MAKTRRGSGAAGTPCGTLAATKVQPNGPMFSASTAKAQAEFEGMVTSGTAASFKLGNLTVTTDSSTRWEGGTAADLLPGVKVEAEGSIANGTLKTSKVSCPGANFAVHYYAPVNLELHWILEAV